MSKPIISMIAAIGRNRELGVGGRLPWNIPEDLKFFKEQTTGKPVIMGRKTYESIGRALPNRTNIVVTRNPKFSAEGIIVASTLDEAIAIASREGPEEIMIIGGSQIFIAAMDMADRLYLTLIDGSFAADTFFPEYSAWSREISRRTVETDDYTIIFLQLEKP